MIFRESLKKLCHRQNTVSSKNIKAKRYKFYIFILLVLLTLLLLPSLFGHAHSKHRTPHERNHSVNHYHSALEANLAKLHQLQEAALRSEKQHDSLWSAMKRRHSKAYRVRQNAPTRMYLSSTEPMAHASKNLKFLDQSQYAGFANKRSQAAVVEADRLAHPEAMIPQGEFIHAVLETAIDSDLPGMVRAVITRPVYSYIGDHLLIPEGSRLIGQYSSKTLQGINRIMVIWQRILLPSGISVQIDSPASDALGNGGLSAGEVDTHFFQRFGLSSLLSLIGAGAAGVDNHSESDNAAQRYRSAVSESFQSSASQTLGNAMAIKPTLRLHQGSRVLVFVARDLDFYSVMKFRPMGS